MPNFIDLICMHCADTATVSITISENIYDKHIEIRSLNAGIFIFIWFIYTQNIMRILIYSVIFDKSIETKDKQIFCEFETISIDMNKNIQYDLIRHFDDALDQIRNQMKFCFIEFTSLHANDDQNQ